MRICFKEGKKVRTDAPETTGGLRGLCGVKCSFAVQGNIVGPLPLALRSHVVVGDSFGITLGRTLELITA